MHTYVRVASKSVSAGIVIVVFFILSAATSDR